MTIEPEPKPEEDQKQTPPTFRGGDPAKWKDAVIWGFNWDAVVEVLEEDLKAGNYAKAVSWAEIYVIPVRVKMILLNGFYKEVEKEFIKKLVTGGSEFPVVFPFYFNLAEPTNLPGNYSADSLPQDISKLTFNVKRFALSMEWEVKRWGDKGRPELLVVYREER